MAGKAVIYLTNSSLVIYQWNSQCLEETLRLFDVDKAKQALSQFFQQYGNKPIKIIVDILEEINSLESFPHLNARDQKSMIERKKIQLFPGSRLIYSEYKGRGSSERRDDLVLFSALTDEKLIDSWLQLLFEIKVNVAGIFSLPVLLENVVKKLQGKTDKLIISISADKQGLLLRQSYFRDNNLILSRFKQINELETQRQAEEIEADINRSQRFVTRHFSMSNNDDISAYFFGSCLGLFDKINFAKLNLKPSYMFTQDFAKQQGDEVFKECSLAAYISALSVKKLHLKSHYKDAKSCFYHNHYLIKRSLNGLSGLCLLLTLAYGTVGYFNYSSQQHQIDGLRKKRTELAQTLSNTAEPPLFKGYSPSELVNQLQALQNIKKSIVDTNHLMNSISLVLEKIPSIHLTKLNWGAPKEQDDLMSPIAVLADPLQGDVMMGAPLATAKSSLLILIQAKFDPFDGDFRYALELIKQFGSLLEEGDSIKQVVATKLPVDISTENELSGGIRVQKKKAEFILEMMWQ